MTPIYSFYTEYYVFFVFFVVSLILSLILFLLTRLLSLGVTILDSEKVAAYECGFEPISDSRQVIDPKFYRVAILFIIFDIEIIFLFPWSVVLSQLDKAAVDHVYYFILVLLIGLYLELNSKSLEW